MKIPRLLMMCAGLVSVLFSSCALRVTDDGCVLGSHTRDGRTYEAGPCVDEHGNVNRVRIAWKNDAGQELRATVFRDLRQTLVEYHAGGGLWLQWTSKSGVILGPLPPEVEVALEDETPLPSVEAAK